MEEKRLRIYLIAILIIAFKIVMKLDRVKIRLRNVRVKENTSL
jgi:hypothetical protein